MCISVAQNNPLTSCITRDEALINILFSMKKILNILFLTFIIGGAAMILGGCSSQSVDASDAIADAEQALADGDSQKALEICNSIYDDDLSKLSEEQLGRLAIIYVKLSDPINGTDHMGEATKCYLQAWEVSTDSMTAFTNSLPPEDLQYIVVLNQVGGSVVSPPDLSHEFEPEDSI